MDRAVNPRVTVLNNIVCCMEVCFLFFVINCKMESFSSKMQTVPCGLSTVCLYYIILTMAEL